MDDKTKLYVFEKKEILLIFVFLILIATVSFLFGVKIGTSHSFKKSGLKNADHQSIQMQSKEEELVEEVIDHKDIKDESKNSQYDKVKEMTEKSLKLNLDNEFMEEEKKFNEADDSAKPVQEAKVVEEPVKEEKKSSGNKQKDKLFGKHTIQIGSYRSLKEAEEFAGGYTPLGYNPIIYDINLGPKGIWYRVSIGAFETIAEAKDYVVKHKSLFDDADYRILKFE